MPYLRCACGSFTRHDHACPRCGGRAYLVTLTRACATREHAERVAALLRQVLEATVVVQGVPGGTHP